MMIMRIFCFNHHATLHDLTLTLLSGIRCYNVKIGIIHKVPNQLQIFVTK